MARFSLLAIAVLAMAASATAWFHAGTVQNEFLVTYSIIPDPFHKLSFFPMPRTLQEAQKDNYILIETRSQDNTKVYCRDFRVCVLFDQQGSVAGIRVSVRKAELDASGLDLTQVPEWEINHHPLANCTVYSLTTFFQSTAELLGGGRTLSEKDLTAPNGIYFLQTDSTGTETGRLHVSTAQSEAESRGFTEQSCFFGMGKHYFQEMHKDGTCENQRPYFLLFGPKTQELNGFGFTQYGKVTTDGRPWYETPPALAAKIIAPNSPACMTDYINKYGIFTMHVYFVSDPYWTFC